MNKELSDKEKQLIVSLAKHWLKLSNGDGRPYLDDFIGEEFKKRQLAPLVGRRASQTAEILTSLIENIRNGGEN